MNVTTLKMGSAAAIFAIAAAACTPAEQRVAGGGLLGAGVGALIGGAIGGNKGAVLGAIVGGMAGLAIADSIERERAREVAYYSARTGSGSSRSFRNSKGQSVVVRTRVVRTTTNTSGERVRVIKRDVVRDGKAAGSDQVEAREVKLASGKTEWVGIE